MSDDAKLLGEDPAETEDAANGLAGTAKDERVVQQAARETGIPEDQARQLQRSTDSGTEFDSAAEAAARWS